ncbi:LysR family transcriptional regulator [Klebsiella pneumoniae]
MDIPIELKHLQTLLALRKTGSLTRAAAAMQLTQSALSHQIKQLEEHYNVTLFMRKTSPVKFTLAGERLLHLAPIRRKTTELTMAIIQQVACQRGIAALPIWAVSEYLEKKYVTAKSITENKLISEVWLATLTENIDKGYVNDFIGFTRQRCLRLLDEI